MTEDDLLCDLDPRGGSFCEPDDCGIYWQPVLSIEWKGGIRFTVIKSLSRRGGGEYFAEREGDIITPIYRFGRIDEAVLRRIQRLVDDIANGKFANKKTIREQIKSIVEKRGLVSYMNDTKWRELLTVLKERFPRNALKYKTLFDEEEPRGYWDIFSDEDIFRMNRASIEYLRIKYVLTQETHVGMLLPPETVHHDRKDELLCIFREYSIPYEYDEAERCFVVYGWK